VTEKKKVVASLVPCLLALVGEILEMMSDLINECHRQALLSAYRYIIRLIGTFHHIGTL